MHIELLSYCKLSKWLHIFWRLIFQLRCSFSRDFHAFHLIFNFPTRYCRCPSVIFKSNCSHCRPDAAFSWKLDGQEENALVKRRTAPGPGSSTDLILNVDFSADKTCENAAVLIKLFVIWKLITFIEKMTWIVDTTINTGVALFRCGPVFSGTPGTS